MLIQNHKLVIVEPNGMVIIRDNTGEEVSFDTPEEFTFYSGIQLPAGLYRLNYEPRHKIFFTEWEDEENPGTPPTYTQLEILIENLGVLKARKADRLYGLEGQALADMEDLIEQENIRAARKQEILNARSNDGLKDFTVQQITNYVNNRVDGAATTAEKIEVFKDIIIKLAIRTL